jgi:hypothetical protein
VNAAFEVLTSSKSNEWYTPPEIIALARTVMGSIELDPASNIVAQEWIQADRYFTEQTNGLAQSWTAKTIWLNPPYGNIGSRFCTKLLADWKRGDFEQAIALVRGDSAAMEALFDHAYHCRSKRIRFVPSAALLAQKQSEAKAKGTTWNNSPVPGSTIFYLGSNYQRFAEVFAQQGKIFAPALLL